MRFTTMCLVVLLAQATASAQGSREESGPGRVSYTAPMPRPAPRPKWVRLATPTPAANGTEYILVGRDAGRFSQVRVDTNHGRVFVVRVAVRYSDGVLQTFPQGRWLDEAHPWIAIDLPRPRWIETIIVTTDRDTRGSYSVFGSSASREE
jgi:hypothetical protein